MTEPVDLIGSDHAKGDVDHTTVQSSLKGVLRARHQITQVEAELGRAIASLERAVGSEADEHPPATGDSRSVPGVPPAAAPDVSRGLPR